MKFGRLTVISEAPNHRGGYTMWLCECECGKVKPIQTSALRSGATVSCGCFHTEFATGLGLASKKFNHESYGLTLHEFKKLRQCFIDMNNRCSPGYKDPDRYYDRGVRVAFDWSRENPKGFDNFLKWALTKGGWRPGLELDKEAIDQKSLLYSEGTCRFVSRSDNNTRKEKQPNRNYIGTESRNGNRYYIDYKRKRISSGYVFATEKEAAIARDRYIIENNLPHALNFPELRNEYSTIS